MLVRQFFDLLRLLVGNAITLLDLSINDLLVLDIDKRAEVGNKGRDQAQTPKRDELDEKVGDQRCEESLHSKGD